MSTRKNINGYTGKRAALTDWRRTSFLEEYAKNANLSSAAKASGIDRALHYRWLNDPGYVAAFEEAHKQACDAIDREIYRRGVTGVQEPVFHLGKRVDSITKYDTTLLIFLAKGLMPDKYRDNYKADISVNGTVKTTHNINLNRLPDGELEQLITILQSAGVPDAPERLIDGGPRGEEETLEKQAGDVLSGERPAET